MSTLPFATGDIVDADRVAERFDVTRATVNRWMLEATFPAPLVVLAIGPIWYFPEVRQWASAFR